jgi:hypothetical protein
VQKVKALKNCCSLPLFHFGVMQIDTPKWINYTSALKTIEVVWRPWLWERQILDLCFVVDCFSLQTGVEKTLYGTHA